MSIERAIGGWDQQGPVTKEIQAWDEKVQTPRYPTGVVPQTQVVLNNRTENSKTHAYQFLDEAVKAMKDRANQRDASGERSMAATVKAFNALTGHKLTEGEGWEFMILLKMVRGRQGGFRMDDYTDGAAYFGLLGECESTKR